MGTCNWSYRGDGSATPRGNANLNKDYKNFFNQMEWQRVGKEIR